MMFGDPQREQDVSAGTTAESRDATPGRFDVNKGVRAVLVALLTGVLGVCGLLAALQVAERGRVEASQRSAAVPDTERTESQSVPSERLTSLMDLLPPSIDGFRTAGRHEVPGFEGSMAEAIFTPLSEEIMIRMPLNCYVVVRAPESGSLSEEFARVSERYPDRIEPAGLEGLGTGDSFVSGERSSYVIGWIQSDHVVLVDTRFTMAAPAEPGEVLSVHANAVATAVAERIGR